VCLERNGGLNQILRRQTSRSHYGLKVPAVNVTVFKYRNKIGIQPTISLEMPVPSQGHYGFHSFPVVD
jgi:hypothetical protein